MHISQVKIKGFRNYKDDTINFNDKTLIIGQNDIGKSNLIYAMRLLLDRSISDYDLELDYSDFYVYEETDEIYIQIKFSGVEDACLIEKFKGSIHENGELFLVLHAKRDSGGKIETTFYSGKDENSLKEINGRYYIRTLNMEYVSSTRNLNNYIKKERQKLLRNTMNLRTSEEEESDIVAMDYLKTQMESTNESIKNLSYISKATENLNNELLKMSSHNKDTNVNFSVINNSTEDILKNLELVSNINGKDLIVGGDGRNNQIFISLWTGKNQVEEDIKTSVTVYCIEEPEAHLHPHQQRKLARYLVDELKGQVILSSHSPQIASEFDPRSIVRLYEKNNSAYAASNGCSKIIEGVLDDFSYRLNIIPAEAFFSKVALLVEGPSEELFYKSLACSLKIDLDRLNISILNVNGIGFKVYISVLKALGIKFVVRTDNDIFKIQKKTNFRCAGLQRCLQIYKEFFTSIPEIETLLKDESVIGDMTDKIISGETLQLVSEFRKELSKIDIFLGEIDLENDLYLSEIKDDLEIFYESQIKGDIIKKMQAKKALTMYSFLRKHFTTLHKLKTNKIAEPLMRCVDLVGEVIE